MFVIMRLVSDLFVNRDCQGVVTSRGPDGTDASTAHLVNAAVVSIMTCGYRN